MQYDAVWCIEVRVEANAYQGKIGRSTEQWAIVQVYMSLLKGQGPCFLQIAGRKLFTV